MHRTPTHPILEPLCSTIRSPIMAEVINGAYHIVEKTGLICIPEAKDLVLSNFAFEANIKIVKGDDGGIGFRINQVNKTFYDFDITTGGAYTLKVYTGKYTTLSEGSNSVINKGLNQSNLVAVVAN